MAIDPYSTCPGGTGKKVKFCCPDLLHELDQIQKMLAGDQRQACLDYVAGLEAKFGVRACLATTKAMLLGEAGRTDEAQKSLDTLLESQAGNPVALAERAMLAAQSEGGKAAVAPLQQALSFATAQVIPSQVVHATLVVAQALLYEGEILAARGHLMQAFRFDPRDREVLSSIVRLNSLASVPLLLKEDFELEDSPQGVNWRESYQSAIEPADHGAWQLAADKLTRLTARVADQTCIWRSLAVLRGWLADRTAAAAAWRQAAALAPDTDDAVEAEALAQLLEPADPVDVFDVLDLERGVSDPSLLAERFLSDPQIVALPFDPRQWRETDQPPPLHAYGLLDRAMPATGVGLRRDEVPVLIGQALLFGRETDRDARLEIKVEAPDRPAVETLITRVGGDALGQELRSESVGTISASQRIMSWNWRFPADTPVDDVQTLIAEQRRYTILDRWPETPQAVLGGDTPQAAAADPKRRRALQGLLLNLTLSLDETTSENLGDPLREKLGLPAEATIEKGDQLIDKIPLVRLGRLRLDDLSDEDLTLVYRRAALASARHAIRRAANEMLSRPTFQGKPETAQLYGQLASMETSSAAALELIDKARAAAEAARQSSAPWDLEELIIRLDRHEGADVTRLVQHIEREHIREPGVAQSLVQILAEAGLISPEMMQGGMPAGPAPQDAPSILVPGSDAASGGSKIWTPDSGQPAGKKSSLWTPDMG